MLLFWKSAHQCHESQTKKVLFYFVPCSVSFVTVCLQKELIPWFFGFLMCVPTGLFCPNEGSFSASAVQTRTILVEMLHKCFSQLREIAAAARSGPEAEWNPSSAQRELFIILTAITSAEVSQRWETRIHTLCANSRLITDGKMLSLIGINLFLHIVADQQISSEFSL